MTSLDEFAEDRDQAVFEENQNIARTNRTLRSALRAVEEARDDAMARLSLYEELSNVKLKPPRWLTPKRKKHPDHVGIPCLALGDIHWCEVVDPGEVDGVNAYSQAIAEQRIKRAFEKTTMLCHDYFQGVAYEGFQLFMTGDMFSGNIHEELRETNESTIMEGVVSLIELLEAGINMLADEFERVNISCVIGNHPRNTRKPRSKFRARDNFDWLLYKLMERDYANDDRVTFSIPDAADDHVTVYGTRYLHTHGDQFRGGSGISGALSPLLLGAHRKTKRQAAAGSPYDVMVMGHWHQSFFLPSRGIIVAGTPKGYDEYAYTSNFDIEEPQVPLWITTPEHGITLYAPVYVMDREEEGW